MTFEEALQVNDLGKDLVEQYSKWGFFTPEAALLAKNIAICEGLSPALVAFTHLTEGTFQLYPFPQTNNYPRCLWNWDVGPFQLSVQWTLRSVFDGEFSSRGLLDVDVFGDFKTFLDHNGNPAPFSGNPLSNGRMAGRKLAKLRQRFQNQDVEAAVHYAGPEHQDSRRRAWVKYGSRLEDFFKLYT